ncbi:MAG: hypothetical protein OIF55_02710, partial [Amphritea sp.]|nr:hypothetical protein [Amphritea sp.]
VTPDFGNDQMWEGLGEEADIWFQQRRAREHDEEMAQLQKEVLQEQISSMRSRNSVATGGYGGFGMPHANTTARVDRNGGTFSPRDDLRLNKIAGHPINENSGWSDAEQIEERYGDFASSLYGFAVAGADALETAQQKLNETYQSVKRGLPRPRWLPDGGFTNPRNFKDLPRPALSKPKSSMQARLNRRSHADRRRRWYPNQYYK